LKRDEKKEFMGAELSSEVYCATPFTGEIEFLNDDNYKKLSKELVIEKLDTDWPTNAPIFYKLTELSLKKVKVISIKLKFYFLEIAFEDKSTFHINTKGCVDDGLGLMDKDEKFTSYGFWSLGNAKIWSFYFGAGEYFLESPMTKEVIKGYWDDSFKDENWCKP